MPREQPTLIEVLEEALDLGAGAGVLLLPVLILAMPCILIVVVPAVLLVIAATVPVAVAAAILTPPYLLLRAVRPRR